MGGDGQNNKNRKVGLVCFYLSFPSCWSCYPFGYSLLMLFLLAMFSFAFKWPLCWPQRGPKMDHPTERGTCTLRQAQDAMSDFPELALLTVSRFHEQASSLSCSFLAGHRPEKRTKHGPFFLFVSSRLNRTSGMPQLRAPVA